MIEICKVLEGIRICRNELPIQQKKKSISYNILQHASCITFQANNATNSTVYTEHYL